MSITPPDDNRQEPASADPMGDLEQKVRASTARFDATMRAAADFAKAHEDRLRRTEAGIKERTADLLLDLRNVADRIPADLQPVTARIAIADAPVTSPVLANSPQLDAVMESIAVGPGIPELIEEVRDLKVRLAAAVAGTSGRGPVEASAGLPERWGGPWISHSAAAKILGYTSAQSGVVASGDTLRKAIKAAPDGEPLALLRDTTKRCAKNPSTGRLRRDAVLHVAGLRDPPPKNAAGTRAMPERGKTRNQRALNAE